MKLFTTLFLVASALLAATSCTGEVTDVLPADAPDNAIAFRMPQTKAAKENFAAGDAFTVWGWRSNGDATDVSTEVFAGEPVASADGSNWSYTGTRYWVLGETYNFHAVYPNTVDAECTSDGAISITGFDASKAGQAAVDLMTAEAKGIRYSTAGDVRPVGLRFSHLLAKVNIVGESEGSNARLTSISLTGVKTAGDYDSSNTETPWNILSGSTSPFTPPALPMELPAVPTDVFGDLLMIPQEVQGVQLQVTYEVPGIEGSAKTFTANLPTTGVTAWEAGRSYRYTFVLSNDYIIFGVPEVNEWNEASGGIIIVD